MFSPKGGAVLGALVVIGFLAVLPGPVAPALMLPTPPHNEVKSLIDTKRIIIDQNNPVKPIRHLRKRQIVANPARAWAAPVSGKFRNAFFTTAQGCAGRLAQVH
ncbi:hypothetical protein [Gallaecimonas pentaromativorans]|uniref:hypothetical protein n=1 Tax=Gallaecimonas pentaromativorans TaxID=584787 RepID=UPI0012EDE89B|nr:hypothetical protein [Gallaecimonas pentaromativorans]